MEKRNKGFSLIELLVVIGIIGLLAGIVIFNVAFSTVKARDTKRIADLTTIGRFMVNAECREPSVSPIDLRDYATELAAAYPQYAQFVSQVPKDPQSGTDSESNYFYAKTGSKCIIYGNLENTETEVTLSILGDPTPGGGTGVLDGTTVGSNGTTMYYQISN